MASSGTLTGSFNGSNGNIFTLFCYWRITNQDVATRVSTVQLQWAVQKSSAAWQTYKQNAAWSQSVDGSSTSGTVNFDIRNVGANVDYYFRPATTVYIQHEVNGTKTASISGTLDLSGTSAGVGSLSGSITLDAIHVDPPTINTFVLSDAGVGQSTVGAWVASKSRIRLEATATAVEAGATIANYAFYANNNLIQSGSSNTYTGANTAIAGDYVFKVVVTDSYGLTAERSLASVTVLPYSKPTIQTQTFRCNADGTENRLGTYLNCKMSWTIDSVGTNAVVLHQITVEGVTTVLTNNTAAVLGNGNIAINQVYYIDYYVTDSFGTPASETYEVLQGKYDFDFHPEGGVAFGAYAEKDKLKTPYDISGNSLTVAEPVSIENGGTGTATAALLAVARVADIIGATTEYYETQSITSTSANETAKVYTVSGSGIVIASATIVTGMDNDYGSTGARILKNNVLYAYNTNRVSVATSHQLGANCVAVMKVVDGDEISLGGFSTKSGTKVLYRNLLAIGCTLS